MDVVVEKFADSFLEPLTEYEDEISERIAVGELRGEDRKEVEARIDKYLETVSYLRLILKGIRVNG